MTKFSKRHATADNRTIFHAAMRDILRDLNSGGEKPYKPHVGSRTIAIDTAIVRYMINHMEQSAFPEDVTGAAT